MTLRKWITFASAAALIAGAACTENRGTSTSSGQTPADNTAQGRRGDTLPRARDAGVADTTGTGAGTGVSGSTSTTPSDSTSSGSSTGTTDTKK
jgi:hypothetical protein